MSKLYLSVTLVTAMLLGSVSAARAVTFGIAGDTPTEAALVATGLGHTAVLLPDLSAGSLVGIDVLWALNSDNDAQLPELLNYTAEVANFVNGGGVFLYHDRNVTDATNVLPGSAGFSIIRDFFDDANINVLDNSTLVTNGPGGIIDDASLDGGSSSSHGYAVSGTLPGASTKILTRTDATEIVDFRYSFGAGHTYYSSIPMDYYFGGPPPPTFVSIYAPNVAAYAASLAIPEPSSLLLLGCGWFGLSTFATRRSRINCRHREVVKERPFEESHSTLSFPEGCHES